VQVEGRGAAIVRMRAAAQLQAQEVAHRLLHASVADAAARAASGRPRSLPAANVGIGVATGPPSAVDRVAGPRRRPGSGSGLRAPSVGSISSANVGFSPMHGVGAAVVMSRGSTPLLPRPPQPPSLLATPSGARTPSVQEAELVLDVGGDGSSEAAVRDKDGGTGFVAGGRHQLRSASRQRGTSSSAAPDALDTWMLQEELEKTKAALARATAAPQVVGNLDLPSLAALRAELAAAHSVALERIDDRRVALQARLAAAQEGPEPGRCVACWAMKADRVLLPCRHLCVCGGCLQSCASKCPVCRAPVVDAIEVYSSA